MFVVVTGGAGYIGSTLVPLLLESGHRVKVVDRFYFGREPLAGAVERHPELLTLHRADVRRLTAADLQGADAVVDLAGISNDPSCELEPDLTRSVNLEATIHTAELAQRVGVRRLVFASSCSVYGHGQTERLTEDSPLNPVSLYAKCKADAERRLFELGARGELAVTALRFATLFGVSGRMRFDLAVNVMTKNAYVDRRITVEGGGRQWRPFVHVRDVAACVKHVLELPRERVAAGVFNVGSDENNVRILNLAYRVRDQIPGTEILMAETDPDLRDYNVSFEKLQRDLDFKPRTGIDEGIAEVLSALREDRVDPRDRRGYTLRQYVFLAEVERTFRQLALDGNVLGAPASAASGGEA